MLSFLSYRQRPIQPQRSRERHHFEGRCECISDGKLNPAAPAFWEKLWGGGDRTLQSLWSSNICWTVTSKKIRPPTFTKTSKGICCLYKKTHELKQKQYLQSAVLETLQHWVSRCFTIKKPYSNFKFMSYSNLPKCNFKPLRKLQS